MSEGGENVFKGVIITLDCGLCLVKSKVKTKHGKRWGKW